MASNTLDSSADRLNHKMEIGGKSTNESGRRPAAGLRRSLSLLAQISSGSNGKRPCGDQSARTNGRSAPATTSLRRAVSTWSLTSSSGSGGKSNELAQLSFGRFLSQRLLSSGSRASSMLSLGRSTSAHVAPTASPKGTTVARATRPPVVRSTSQLGGSSSSLLDQVFARRRRSNSRLATSSSSTSINSSKSKLLSLAESAKPSPRVMGQRSQSVLTSNSTASRIPTTSNNKTPEVAAKKLRLPLVASSSVTNLRVKCDRGKSKSQTMTGSKQQVATEPATTAKTLKIAPAKERPKKQATSVKHADSKKSTSCSKPELAENMILLNNHNASSKKTIASSAIPGAPVKTTPSRDRKSNLWPIRSLLHLGNSARRESRLQQQKQQAAADEQTGGRAAASEQQPDTSKQEEIGESVQEQAGASKMKRCPSTGGRDNDTARRDHQSDTSFELVVPAAPSPLSPSSDTGTLAAATTNLAAGARLSGDLPSNTPTLKFAAPTTMKSADGNAAKELSCQADRRESDKDDAATRGEKVADTASGQQRSQAAPVESRPLEREQLDSETQQASAMNDDDDESAKQANDANLAINLTGPRETAAQSDDERQVTGDLQDDKQQQHLSSNEIFIESAWSLEQKLKESPIRVRAITSQEASKPATTAAIMWLPVSSASELTPIAGRPENHRASEECQEDDKQQQVARFFESHKGKEWRTHQLDHQIPHQDFKLLAMAPDETPAAKRDTESNGVGGKHQTIGDEIKFIRSQRKAASQFKASLYYLNPCISSGQEATQRTSSIVSKDATSPGHQRLHERNTNCFKCKKSIELGTTCVRVDNLMQDKVRTARKQHKQDVVVPNEANKEAKCSSHGNNQQNHLNHHHHHHNHQTREAIFQIADENERCAEVNKRENTITASKSESEKSSSDEGLGSGTSSQSNSAAGSHCDDRETPPHISEHQHHLHMDKERPTTARELTTSTTDCDTNHLNPEISSDSLEVSKSAVKSGKTHRRHKSIGGGSDKNGKLFSRKNRALTWSASLSSLGASLKFGASCTSTPKSRSDTNLQARDDHYELIGTSGAEFKLASGELKTSAEEDVPPIFFHTDCFCCATCNEILVDLRALIYVNDSSTSPSRQQHQSATNQQAADSEYINLPQDNELPLPQREDDSEDDNRQQQISLYCHRHFVELFKPRCQQCDCLILDEECTEAEGKVWHIKHFCCAECKVPLGGHQYIIVDQALEQARHQRRPHSQSQATSGGAAKTPHQTPAANSQPYCLRCFDKNFGETCVACHKLITCDSGAINHEQRSWHASAQCFRCAHCLKSLLGCPFLPSSQDGGRIYCSIRCSDQMVGGPNGGRMNPLAVPPKPNQAAAQVQNLSLAHYLDPRAMPSAIQHDLELNKSALGGKKLGALTSRHKQLVEYLAANARTDETSYQLLRYLQVKFERELAEPGHQQTGGGRRHDRELLDRIAQTLAVLERERATASNEERARRNKLNPFLVDLDSAGQPLSGQHNKRPFMEPQDRLVCMMMDRVLDETSAQFQQQQNGSKLQDYINLDCLAPLTVSSGKQSGATGSGKIVGVTDSRLGGNASQISKISQCSPVASLISNEGTISDHSATSSGVSTAPPGNNSANGSLKSHSPLSSTSSHDSSASGGGGGSLHHTRQSSSCSSNTGTTGTSNQPLRTSPAINSIAASLERRRRVQPITELSVVDLLTVADQVDHHNPNHHQRQHLFTGHYNQPAKVHSPGNSADGFDQLVSQFGTNIGGVATSGAPVTAALKRQQQQQKGSLKVPFGANKAAKQQNPTGGLGGKQQPDSFFYELAQRLPRAARGLVQASASDAMVQQTSGIVQVATSGPLDTNGLPTVDSETPSSACESSAAAPTTARTITDHYSTVNKAHKQRQMANERDRQTRDNFFAITSPLLECQVDAPLTSTSGGSQLAPNATNPQHPSQLIRPTSSLSIFAGDNNGAQPHQQQHNLHGSYSTSSLNRAQQQQTAPPTTTNQEQQQQRQKPPTRPAKSVSFDPNVKDPPSSSTMTLGRAATLKSALKQTQQQQQQQQMAWQQQLEMLAAADLQAQMPAAASSATMPASFAAQLKAASGSIAAYSAHYDEFGRRIRLSTLQQLQQLQQQFVNGQESNLLGQVAVAQEDNQNGSKLASLPGGSLLAKLGSRGGRREERKMRQEQQQPGAAGGPVLTQPAAGTLPMLANNEHLLMPSTSGLQQQQQQSLIIEAHEVSPTASSSRRSSHSVGSNSSARRASSSRRTSGSHKHASYRRERRSTSSAQTRRRRSSSKASGCKSRNCRDPKCLYDDDDTEDDDDYSSSCSTCSSSQSYDDESDDERRPRNHRRSYRSRRRHHGRNHRASRRQRYVSTTSSSECDSYTDDDYSDDVYDSDDASSYTSYTSASNSDSDDDHLKPLQGRVTSDKNGDDDDDEENGGAYADDDQQSCSSNSSGEARRNRSSSRKRRDSRSGPGANRSSRSSKSSRSSDSTLVSNRSASSASSRHANRRGQRIHQRRTSQKSAHRSAPLSDRRHRDHARSSRSSNSGGRSDQHQRRHKNHAHHHHHRHHQRHESSAHLEPQTPAVMAQAMLPVPADHIMHSEAQLLHDRNQPTATNLIRSPSSMSNDSKMARDESCRII